MLLTCNRGPRVFPSPGAVKDRGLGGSCVTVTREDRTRPASARGRLWLWVRRGLFVLVGVILVALLAGLVYQFVATRLAHREYPAPGEMVAVSGHGMQLYCTGKARGGRPW